MIKINNRDVNSFLLHAFINLFIKGLNKYKATKHNIKDSPK